MEYFVLFCICGEDFPSWWEALFVIIPPTPILRKSSGRQVFQGPCRWLRKPPGLVPSTPLCRKQALGGGDERRENRSLPASMPTHCSTERVRLVANASAMDLAPSSLILLLWRLWRQGEASLVEPKRVPGRPSPHTPREWGSWPFPPLLWPQAFPGFSRHLPAGCGQGAPDH